MGIGNYIKEAGKAFKELKTATQEKVLGLEQKVALSESSTSLLQSLMGNVGDIGDFYFPPDIIGGVCPRIPGEEESIVWNAAVEACDTERVKIVWQSAGSMVWYLAVKTSDLASNPNSWCPFAALLPRDAKDVANLPACYTYYGDELAILMVVAIDGLQVFRGTAAVIRAKAERMSREYGGKQKPVEIINIDLFQIGKMTPVPWYSASLFEDRARRILATSSVLVSLAIVVFSFVVWLLASMTMVAARHELADTKEQTHMKTMKLLSEAQDMRSSQLRDQIEKFLNVNEGLLNLNGFLTVYEIKDKYTRWKATVPVSTTADRISAIGGKSIETTDRGMTIGNDAEIAFESNLKGKR
ncbi:MAG: hypothetical protein PHE27_03215 [Alphaproteobacteria bacterium]|nr:hypothetical protein [Alphaproteobacteria bacterium]